MSRDLSTDISTSCVRPFDAQQPGSQGLAAGQCFPLLDEHEYSVMNPEFQNEFFEELRWEGSVADRAGLDMIMNIGFDEY